MNSSRQTINFLTGGSGFLGSHIGAELLRRGQDTFFLVRNHSKKEPRERLEKVLDWHGIDHRIRSKAHLVKGSLADLGSISNATGLPRIDRVIHCASDTSFSERWRERIWHTNVENLMCLLDFVDQKKIPAFIHVSTAYAAGKKIGRCLEKPPENNRFFNAYEESKAAAERILLERARKMDVDVTILRPSIVYGHSQTGRTFRFNALYYPIKAVLFLKKVFVEDIKRKGGMKAAAAGVSMEACGSTDLPLRIDADESSGINLIPVDFFVDAFFAVAEDSVSTGIYHIVNPVQTRIADIVDYIQEQFRLKGIRTCPPQEFQRIPRNLLERLFESYLQAYSPYMKDQRRFTTKRMEPVLKRRGLVCPPFDADMCRRCMAYADKNGWSAAGLT